MRLSAHPSGKGVSALAPGPKQRSAISANAPIRTFVDEILRFNPDKTFRVLHQLWHYQNFASQGLPSPMQRAEELTGLRSRHIRF